MASHLTISVELIAFMKWVLQKKQAALNTFLDQVMDQELRTELEQLVQSPVDVSSDELYAIVNNFLGHVEEQILDRLDTDTGQNQQHLPQSTGVDSASLYHSLPPQMQAQLTQAFDDDVLVQGVHKAATALSNEPGRAQPEHSEQVKKHILMQSLLSSWSPPSDDEVN